MKHFGFLFVSLWLTVGLVACQSPAPKATPTRPEPSATPVAEAPTPQPTATLVAEAPTPQPTATPPVVQATSLPEDTPVPTAEAAKARPSPTPTTPWQIPKVRADDWATGGADAGLIVVEYSDFQ